MSIFDRIDEKSKGIVQKGKEKEVQADIKKHIVFSFEAEQETLDYLKNQTVKLNSSMSKAYTEVGQIFSETQKELANNKNGVFESWYTELGFNKKQVYRWIMRYEFISCQNDTIKNLIENLPVTLSYEISNPRCDKELVERVLRGEITSLREFNEAKQLSYKEVENKESIPETVNINSILSRDFNILTKNLKTFDEIFQEKIVNLPQERKEFITKKIESLNKEIEKLLKNL